MSRICGELIRPSLDAIATEATGGHSLLVSTAWGSAVVAKKFDELTNSIAGAAEIKLVTNLEPGNLNSTSLARNSDRLVIDQGSFPTCGSTSCAMILDSAGKPFELSALISQSGVTANGTTMPKLAQVLNASGLESKRVLNATIDDLAKETLNNPS
ncbi:cysteine peptidase family C39 domain-containing protein [Xanthomonas citri]|uniref:cysteine peptidase family C39 domain-containing protein n=2 Tax=Xanthomonas TaxID=338 RepID=UPI0013141A22|nr:cysteine peptidase family C39 domain-containing protein [Xanthomonas citri]QTJ31229.1 hypothetical protein XcfCFBP6975P_23840 [Xanthomonas citri pv. phaseoli var. fuscans]